MTQMPPTWKIPRDWPGERCFILCSGESIGSQFETICKLKGRFIAVKHGVLLRSNADVLFLVGETTPPAYDADLISAFTGTHILMRGKWNALYDHYGVKRLTRTKDHTALCELRDHVSGYDAGTSAINIAYHFGATEIIMLGYDMRGGHFCQHPLQYPPESHFRRHIAFLRNLNQDALSKGVKIINCSPGSAVEAFEKRRLEEFL